MGRIMMLAAVAAVVVATIAAPAVAMEPAGEAPVAMALGDSLATGVGATNPDRTGYVPRVHRWARADVDCTDGNSPTCPHVESINLAIGGARTDTLIAEQLPAALAEIGRRNHDADPANDVVLITLDIGGNDVYGPVLGACAAGVTPGCVATIDSTFTVVAQNLGFILGSLRAAAGDNAQIVVMTYFNPLVGCHLAGIAPLGDLVLEGGGGLPFGLNDIIRGVAGATGADVAETFGLLGPEDLVGGDDCLHANDDGYQKIAKAFRKVVR